MSLEEQFKANPYKFIKERGLTLEQMTEMELLDGNPTQDMKLSRMQEQMQKAYDEKIAKLEARLNDKEASEQQEKVSSQEQAFMKNLTTFIESDEKYELIRAQGSINIVRDVMQEYYDTNEEAISAGEVEMLSYADAADAVEAHLEAEAKKLLELKKVKGLQIPSSAKKPIAPTLSNTLAAEVPKTGNRLLSDEESKKRMAAMLRWKE